MPLPVIMILSRNIPCFYLNNLIFKAERHWDLLVNLLLKVGSRRDFGEGKTSVIYNQSSISRLTKVTCSKFMSLNKIYSYIGLCTVDENRFSC